MYKNFNFVCSRSLAASILLRMRLVPWLPFIVCGERGMLLLVKVFLLIKDAKLLDVRAYFDFIAILVS